jgi:hypothetical protein
MCKCGTASCHCPRAALNPIFDGAKSFYGKAFVTSCAGRLKLWSYGTLVAEIDTSNHSAHVYNIASRTTLRHIREFLLQHGFEAANMKQIKNYV